MAPFWPDLLAVRDTLSYAELSERFGPAAWAIRTAFERAGIPKRAMPRGPRAYRKLDAEAPAAPAVAPVDSLAALAGKATDAEVAERAGVSIRDVKAHRRAHDVAPFLRPPPKGAGSPATSSVAASPPPAPAAAPASVASGAKVLRRRVAVDGTVQDIVVRDEPIRIAREPAPERALERSAPTSAPAPTTNVRRARVSALDAFLGEIGTVPDRVIAAKAGVGVPAVAQYRSRRRIPAFVTTKSLAAPSEVSTEGSSSTATESSGARSSKLDPFRHLIGKLPDHRIASMAGTVHRNVQKYRARHGIPAYRKGVRVELPEDLRWPETPPRHRGRPGSKLDPWRHLVGVRPDREVAGLAGVQVASVCTFRTRRGIPAAPRTPPGSTVPSSPSALVSPPPATGLTEAPAIAEERSGVMLAFGIIVRSGERKARFVVVGEDIVEAVARATRVLAGRTDGPWSVRSVRYLSEAL